MTREKRGFHEIWNKAWQSRFMRGWDAAISGRETNPYSRRDYRDDWQHGHDRCMAGKPLPPWYEEWHCRRPRRRGGER